MNLSFKNLIIFTLHVLVGISIVIFYETILSHISSTIWSVFLLILKPLCLLPFYTIQSFYSSFLYITAIILAVATILASNPIYSLLSLIAVFLHILLFMLALKIEFLSFIFLIIYIGAIAILFLFVIMMFNLKQLSWNAQNLISINIKTVSSAFLLGYPILKTYFIIEKHLTIFVLTTLLNSNTSIMKTLNIQEIISHKIKDILLFSDILYTYHAFIFILSSFILFAAMIGAIILALQTSGSNIAPDNRNSFNNGLEKM